MSGESVARGTGLVPLQDLFGDMVILLGGKADHGQLDASDLVWPWFASRASGSEPRIGTLLLAPVLRSAVGACEADAIAASAIAIADRAARVRDSGAIDPGDPRCVHLLAFEHGHLIGLHDPTLFGPGERGVFLTSGWHQGMPSHLTMAILVGHPLVNEEERDVLRYLFASIAAGWHELRVGSKTGEA